MERAKLLAGLRREKGLSQREAAEELGVTRQAISRWEAGYAWPSAENLVALSRLYGIPLEELLQSDTGQTKAEPAAVSERQTRRRPGKGGWLLLISIAVSGGLLLWGWMTNSRSTAMSHLIFFWFLILAGWIIYNLYCIFSYFHKKYGGDK